MQLPAQAIEAVLARAPLARLATLREDGSAALVPIVFARVGSDLWSPVDGKPKRGGALARLRHVARDPRVALLIDAWDARWSRLWWLRLEGRASVERVGEAHADAAGCRAAEQALRAKYPQYARTPLFRGAPTLLRISVLRHSSWAASPEAISAISGTFFS